MAGRRWHGAALCIAVISALVAGCGSGSDSGPSAGSAKAVDPDTPWDEVVAAAKSEGSVVLYSARQPSNLEALERAFEKKYPEIDLKWTRDNSGNLLAKAEAEERGGSDGADVLMVTDLTWYEKTAKSGKFLPLSPAVLENLPKTSVFDTWAYSAFDPWVIGINTESGARDAAGYADLLTKNPNGTIGLLDPSVSATATAVYINLTERLGEDYIRRLVANHKVSLYPSTTPMAQALGSKEIDASIGAVPDSIAALARSGAPVKYVIPDIGYSGFPYGLAAFKWAKRPAAARVLVDFMLSMEGQTAMCGNQACVSVLDGVPGAFPREGMDVLDPRNYTQEAVNNFRSRFAGDVRS